MVRGGGIHQGAIVMAPRLAKRVLRLFASADRRDEIEADLDDLFERRAAARGRAYAWRRYWADVLSVTLRRRAPGAISGVSAERASLATALAFDVRQAVRG